MRRRSLVLYGLLAVVTVAVFLAFDSRSHSASDTLRPFIITMAPVWAVAILAGRAMGARQ